MKKLNLFNRSGMSPDGTSRKGRYSLDPILSRLCLVSLICLCVLTIGSGNVWAGNEVYKTALFGSSYNSTGVQNYTSTWYSTNSGFRVDITNANNNNNGWSYIKMGSKSAASVGKITTNAAIDKKITQVRITVDAVSASNINSIKLYKSTNKSNWTELGSYTVKTGAKDVAIAAGNQATNLYYEIRVDCKKSSNGVITISKVEYYIDGVTTTTVLLNKNTGTTNGSAEFSLGESSYNSFTAAVPASCKICTGYWTATSGGNKVLNPDGSFAADNVTGWITSGKWSKDANSATLYAQWRDEIYSVTLKDNNATLTQASCGASVTLPSRAGCSGYTFAGWTKSWTEEQDEWTTTAPTIIPAGSYTPSDDEDLYPVYTKTESGGTTTGSKTLVSKSTSTYYTSGDITGVAGTNSASWTADAFTMVQYKNGSSSAVPLSYDEIRVYASHSLVFTPSTGTTITSIVVTANSDSYATALGGNSITNCTKSVSGSTVTITPTDGTAAITLVQSAQSRLNKIVVNYSTSGGSTTSYISVPNCCTKYDITKAGGGTVGGGTFSADATSACEGATVTLSTNICSGYTVGAWDVYKTGTPATKITVTSNQFTMPAYGVTVALSTTAKVDQFIDQMHETTGYTGEGYAVSGCNQTVPTISNKSKGSECVGEHYKFVGWVDEDHVDSDGTLLTGYSIVSGGTTSWNATGTTYYAIWAKEL